MNILLVYPKIPNTFWSFKNALKFIAKKSSEPPLGLVTVAAMLPRDWDKKLIDLNVSSLHDKDLAWADFVFISGMEVHINSFKKIVRRCNTLGVKVVAGGPMCTLNHEQFLGVDHFVLDEAEVTLPRFVKDVQQGTAKKVYRSNHFPDLGTSPTPFWHLLKMKHYASMSIQYSRGCPYDCEFCNITVLNGRQPRVKSGEQFLEELTALYNAGWRRDVFIVDDNFIGNKKQLKTDLLPRLINWSKTRKYPFHFTTEVSINLSDDDQLINMMVEAGVSKVFVGIETPSNESLKGCGKKQNVGRNLMASVKKLQRSGLIVYGGFIIGFDEDSHRIFDDQINFIQKSGIVTAMVGLLTAVTGTRLFSRLKKENRLLESSTGDNMDGSLNFIPKMNYQKLIQGYKKVLTTVYSQKQYYYRVKTFLKEYKPPSLGSVVRISWNEIMAVLKSVWYLGILEKGRIYYWKLIAYSLFRHPAKFPLAVTMAIYGFHFRRVIEAV
jgi:radical SAM superfamily enzyme YgiQ (UPF0313 family)